uniref:Uncharacterized protein n=1 Tax=Oncorhynchus kisutch TaxID=8019 RepID=A0A8C7JQF6_ONCKI
LHPHLFVCYFGLGVTFVLYQPSLNDGHVKGMTSYQSDILSVMGTLVLWVLVLQTFISLISLSMTAFSLSNVTLVGGVTVEASISAHPWEETQSCWSCSS